jgi:multidrug efflux system membrane fusion protein
MMASERKAAHAPRRRPAVRAVLGGAALVLCAAFFLQRLAARPGEAASPQRAPAEIAVETALASRADVPVYLEGLGTVQAYYTVKVTPRVDGQLERVGFVEGQKVKKGAFLAQIDPRPFKAALAQAVAARDKDAAQLANAKRDLARYEDLAPQNLVSRQTLDAQRAQVGQLEAQLESDRAAIDAARTQLDYTTITSPIAGRTGMRQVDPGNVVHAALTTGIVVVTQMQPISAVFTLPQDHLLAVRDALAAGRVPAIALARAGGRELDRGSVAVVDNEIDAASGTMRLKATFPNAHERLWPGEFVKVRTLVGIRHRALTIPAAALQRGPDGEFAYVVRPDSTVAAQPVRTGLESGASVVVESGLQEGARVVTSNQFRLQPGARVRVLAASAARRAPAGARDASR